MSAKLHPLSNHLRETGNRLLRTRDLAPWYAQPSNETARLVRNGVLAKVAHGYFVIVPEARRDGTWRPSIEDLTLAIGVADYGGDHSALLGHSAARVLGAIPRALSSGVIAVPVHRSPLETRFGRVIFAARDSQRLDLQRYSGELTSGFCTSAEQTVLDLVARTTTDSDITEALASAAIRALLPSCDFDTLTHLAHEQRKVRALRMLRAETRR